MENHKNNVDLELLKQKIQDLERLFNVDLGKFLILNEEGKENQIQEARSMLRSHLLKYAQDMKKEAMELGSETAALVEQFIASLETLLNHMPDGLDPAELNEHHKLSIFLENLVKNKLKGNSNNEL